MNQCEFAKAYEEGFLRTEKFLVSRGVRRDNAREFAQEAWTLAWEHIDQLRNDTKIVGWVNTIAWNEFLRMGRTRRLTVAMEIDHEPTTLIDTAAIDVATILGASTPHNRRY